MRIIKLLKGISYQQHHESGGKRMLFSMGCGSKWGTTGVGVRPTVIPLVRQ